MDRSIEVRTPESVAFSYQLAGLGSRFLAVVADGFLQAALVVALFFALISLAAHAPRGGAAHSGDLLGSIAIAVFLFVLFMILFGYFIVFEAFWNGQTPGKRLLGIRVVRDGGYPIDFSASLVRNLIRIVESSIGFYFISAVCALASSENKRVGDFAAGTIVVRDSRVDAPPVPLGEQTQYAATSLVGGEERALVHQFLERRATLPWERRVELAEQLARRIRPRVGPELARLDDESLLERL